MLRMFAKMNKSENFVPGFICVLHTFGRKVAFAHLEEHLYVPTFSIDPEDFILIQIYISGNKADILIFRVSFCKHRMLSKQCKHEIL